MRPQEINRNINLAFKRFARDGNLIHFQKCKKHLLKSLEWFRKTDPELTESGSGKTFYKTYAYYVDNIETMDDIVKTQFRYMSDRWNRPGSIKFMLEVIN